MSWTPGPPAPSEAPKPINPEPTAAPKNPEHDVVHDPEQGKSEHPKQ